MSKLIAIVGNSGVGKTTLARRLHEAYGWAMGLEQFHERPFQALFAQNLERYALANQVDYLLYRAEQEAELRRGTGIALVDGGLEQDIHLFTRLFHQKGYLSATEYDLCLRLYALARRAAPPPDLLLWLEAPLDVIAARYQARQRPLEIAQLADLRALDALLAEWKTHNLLPTIWIDASSAAFDTPDWLNALIEQITPILSPTGASP